MFVTNFNKALCNLLGPLFLLWLLGLPGVVFADGGDWKMGPFGPYWDDNDWPEYTPMYWMEEFLNRIDDDNDDIQRWMQNQRLSRSNNPQNSLSNSFNEPSSFLSSNLMGRRSNYLNSYKNSVDNRANRSLYNPTGRIDHFMNVWNVPEARHMLNDAGVPELSRKEYVRMPKSYQRAYQNILRNAYLANGLREPSRGRFEYRQPTRNQAQIRQQDQQFLMNRKRKKSSAYFVE